MSTLPKGAVGPNTTRLSISHGNSSQSLDLSKVVTPEGIPIECTSLKRKPMSLLAALAALCCIKGVKLVGFILYTFCDAAC